MRLKQLLKDLNQMAKKRKVSSGLPTMAGYEGLCSRFTDLVGMKSVLPAAAWEKHVVSRTLCILQFDRPDLLEEIKKAVKESYGNTGRRMPKHVDAEEGRTTRCPTCNKTW